MMDVLEVMVKKFMVVCIGNSTVSRGIWDKYRE